MSSTRQQIWVLVLFEEEKVLSHPIPLGEVQDLSGCNVEEAYLREGVECMTRLDVGEGMRKATIIKCSENREELNEIYKEILGVAKENQALQRKSWVLVLFDEEKVLSHPIPLGEVQDLSGRNVEEAHLKEGVECMTRLNVGDRMRKATIIKRSENREELNEIYKEILGIKKTMQAKNDARNFWKKAKVLFVGLLVGGAAVAAAPLVLSHEGFSSGRFLADSWIATLQKACAAWFSATTNLIIGTIALSEVSLASSACTFWQRAKVLFVGLLVGGAAVAVAPLVLSLEGFSSGGYLADSWTATLQAACAAWFSATTNLIIGTIALSAVSLAFKLSKCLAFNPGTFWQQAKVLFAGLLVGGAAVAVAPFVLSPEEFSSRGDSWTATLQAAFGAWFSATKNLTIGIIAVSTVLLVYKLSKNEPPEDSDPTSNLTPKSPEAKPSLSIHPASPQTLDLRVEDLIAQVESINSNAQAETKLLYRENQRLHEEKQCKICMDAEMDTLFTPCGHFCTCRRCALELNDCPICKKKIQNSHRVFKS